VTTAHDTLVTSIISRNRRRGYGIAWREGSHDPDDTVQDASLILLRLRTISAVPAEQDGLWTQVMRWAIQAERNRARQQIRAGTASNLATVPQYLLPSSPSAESVALRDEVDERLLAGLGRMMPSDRARFDRRLADWKRHAEPFTPAVEALARHKEIARCRP